MLEGERAKLLAMEEELGKRVIGQEHAVAAVSRADPPRPRRPAGPEPADGLASCSSGPTGVGKTELTKALAEFLFDDRARDGPDRHVASSWRSTASPG